LFSHLFRQTFQVFPLKANSRDGVCHGIQDVSEVWTWTIMDCISSWILFFILANQVLKHYREAVQTTKLGGPTSFVPLINKAIKIVQKTKGWWTQNLSTNPISDWQL
jgi:hypothetical protein